MAILLILFLNLAPHEGQPYIVWHFSMPHCEPCRLKQIDVMKKYFREGDKAIIVADDEFRAESLDLKSQLFRTLKVEAVIVRPEETAFGKHGVGFDWFDPLSQERIGYQSLAGSYNPLRAKAILNMYR